MLGGAIWGVVITTGTPSQAKDKEVPWEEMVR
jgi:hypothetical protein